MHQLHRRILRNLLQREDRRAAEESMELHSRLPHRCLDLQAPELDRLLRRFKPEIRALTCVEVLALAQSLYAEEIDEALLAGDFVLKNRIACIGEAELPFLDRALEHFRCWATVDGFCLDVLQPVLLKHPRQTLRLLQTWNASENMWKRRASVVAFTRKVGKSGKFTHPALRLCEALLWDQEALVQKGVGWCLKDVMRGEKKTVLEYVMGLRKRGAPAAINLYAIRDLKGAERAEVLHAGER